MDHNNRYLPSVPHNINSLNEFPEGMLWEDIEFEDFEISEADYENLFDLFCQFNQEFDIFIDEYEEEEITADKIQAAVKLTEEYAKKAPAEVKKSTEKLLSALRRAADLGKPLELFF